MMNDKAELFAPGAVLRNFRILGILRLLARRLVTRSTWMSDFRSCQDGAPAGSLDRAIRAR